MTARRASLVWLLAALAGCGAATTPANDAAADRAQPLDSSASPDSAAPDATQPDSALEDSAADAPRDAMADSSRDVANDTPADVPADTPAPLEPSCDARRVLCDRPEPVCGRGEAPSVVGSCWGPCIAATSCACASDEECPRVPGYSEVCYRTRMRCGPLL